MKHFISLDKAKKMTALYRKEKEHKDKLILPLCETFDAEPFRTILGKPGCVSLRIYYGLDDEKRVHAIIVGVNDKNEDMVSNTQGTMGTLSTATTTTTNTTGDTTDTTTDATTDPEEEIIEDSQPCPPFCPPPSPLNG